MLVPQVKWLGDTGIELIRGHARIAGEKRVEVTAKDGTVTEVVANSAVVIATGPVSASPPIPGLAESGPWDSRVITNLTEPPESLIIVGGGVVGVEMAQAWKDLGTKDDTILERGSSLLAREESFAGEHLQKVFTEEYGIKVLTDADCTKGERRDNGKVVVTCDDNPIEADEILVATGRRANTSDIGLEVVGLQPGKFVPVDDQMRVTSVEGDWLFAVGGANGRSLLTHDDKYPGENRRRRHRRQGYSCLRRHYGFTPGCFHRSACRGCRAHRSKSYRQRPQRTGRRLRVWLDRRCRHVCRGHRR